MNKQRLLAIVILLGSSLLQAQEANHSGDAKAILTDTAILEVELPLGAQLLEDGKVTQQRRFTYQQLESGKLYSHEVKVRWADGKETVRTVLYKSGWHVRLPILPVDAERPEMVLQTGHSSWVWSVAFSPDGKFVLTGAMDDKNAILWDVATGSVLRFFTWEGRGTLDCAAFSPDGSKILVGQTDLAVGSGAGKAILFDTVTGKPLRTFLGHTAGVKSLAFSPDGKQIITGSYDRTAILWDAVTGDQLRIFKGHVLVVFCVGFSPDGKNVFTGSADKKVILWKTTGETIHTLAGHTDHVRSAAYSPDGTQVLTAGNDKKAILWDATTGQQLRTFTDLGYLVGFTPNGKQFLATDGGGKAVVLCDPVTGQKLRTFQWHDSVLSLSFHRDGKQFLAGSLRSAVLWDATNGQKLREFTGHVSPISSVVYHPNGDRVLTGTRTGSAILWDLKSDRMVVTVPGHKGTVNKAIFSSDGNRILTTGSDDKTAILWDLPSKKMLHRFRGHTDWILCGAISPDGKQVLTGSIDKTAILWDTAKGEKVHVFQPNKQVVRSVAFSPDGKQVAIGTLGPAFLYETATAKLQLNMQPVRFSCVDAMEFSQDGSRLFGGLDTDHGVFWDRANGRVLSNFSTHRTRTTSRAISPDWTQVAAGSYDGTTELWSVANERLRVFEGHTAQVHGVSFNPDARRIMTGSGDGSLRLWDIATGDELCRLVGLDGGQGWAVITPEGLFDGSKSGREQVAFRIGSGLNVVPLDRFFQDFYHPGLLADLWRGERPMPGKPFKVSPAPSLKMLVQNQEPGVRNQESGVRNQESGIRIDVAVTDQGGGVKGPWLQHNGAVLRAGTAIKKDGNTTQFRFPISLVPGANRIEVRAATKDGSVESDPAVVNIPFDGTLPAPELHVIAVGINRFAKGAGVANLDFGVPDAKAIADLFKQRSGGAYRQVHITALHDDQATRAGILKAVKDVAAKARPQDTLVVYAATHGITLGQRFYLIPHDFKLDKDAKPEPKPESTSIVSMRGYRGTSDEREAAVRTHALAIDELGEALAEVPALKRVLIFDTCQSGSAASLAGKKQNPFAFRGAMERFSRAQGVYCLSATAADELAAETGDLGHAILTYTLLAGAGAAEKGPLAGKKATSGDVLDWFRFARDQVPGLYVKYVGRPQQVELSGEDQPGFPLLGQAK